MISAMGSREVYLSMMNRGFASGLADREESIKFGVVAACKHPQIDYNKVNYSKAPYASQPSGVITYAECHDNHVLWDKLAISARNATEDQRQEMHKLALSIVLTSQGISFFMQAPNFCAPNKEMKTRLMQATVSMPLTGV